MLHHTNPAALIAPSTGFTIAITATHTYIDKLIYLSGIVAQDIAGKVVGLGDPEAQFKSIWDNIEATLADVDSNMIDIVSTTTYVVGREYLEALEAERKSRFASDPPASTVVIVAGLPNPYHLAAITVTAVANLPSDVDFDANHHTHLNEETEDTTADTTSRNVGDHGGHVHSYTHKHGRPTTPVP